MKPAEGAWERVRVWLDEWFGEMVLRPQMFGEGAHLEHTVFNLLSVEMEGYHEEPSPKFLKGVVGLYYDWLNQHGVTPGNCVSAFNPGQKRPPPTTERAYEILIEFVRHTRSSYLPKGGNSTPLLTEQGPTKSPIRDSSGET